MSQHALCLNANIRLLIHNGWSSWPLTSLGCSTSKVKPVRSGDVYGPGCSISLFFPFISFFTSRVIISFRVMREVERGQTGKGPSTSSAVSAPPPLQKVAGNYRGSHKLEPTHQRAAGSTPHITGAKEGSTPLRPEGAAGTRWVLWSIDTHIHQERGWEELKSYSAG